MSAGVSSLSLLWVVLFIGAIACLPWLARRWQRGRGAPALSAGGAGARVLSSLTIGPQQRVVTMETGSAEERVVLVLGVTAQAITCLHVLPAASFAGAVAAARTEPSLD
ncbi:FliO/MopB family protein [Comamonas flocculans]|uniref:Flagellar biosynthetic protein FliO n=1 Tax=Comamonas flocculans TaxID=2597701 RepID=A0A5B8RUZ5_9BURK|nr:flagellar biosynthetic protein FliO [Comamonas flocculans]QEA12562.1 flagellar biosynthetic protein FliO [Comamonas flocculans]